MPTVPSRDRSDIVDEIRRYAGDRLPPEQQRLFLAFIGQYYRRIARDDLAARPVHDLYGAAMSHLTLALDRPPGTPAVRVYSPDFEEHGFGSPHTVVDVVTDDMPFLVDSVTTEVIRHGLGLHLTVHPVVPVRRDAGRLVDVLDRHDATTGTLAESFVHLEVDRQTDAAVLDELGSDVLRVLGDVRAAVEDWPAMRERALAVADTLDVDAAVLDEADRDEAAALLRWLTDDHFTFLGYREYELGTEDGEDALRAVPGTGLGLLRDSRSRPVSHSFAKLPPEVRQRAREPGLLNLTKANSRSTVHRPNYLDYVGVKRLSPEGDAVGERRFLGLVASAVYRQSPQDIPVLRRKVRAVLDRAGHPSDSYDGRMLRNILEGYPREELFQIDADELYEAATTILDIQDRQRLRLLVRRDVFGRFMSCLVYLPRDRLTTALRTRIEGILKAAFHGVSTQYATQVSESVLARLLITVHTEPGAVPEYDVAEIEARLVAAMRSWTDDLYDALVDQLGEELGVDLHHRYADAFPGAYQQDTSAAAAVVDIKRMEGLGDGDDLAMHLYRPLEAAPGTLRFKLFRHGGSVTLSDVLPLLENMGVHVVDERPYVIRPSGAEPVWIYDFGLRHEQLTGLDTDGMRERFQEAFAMVWRGELEDDGLNRLVLRSGLRGREVAVVRAYAKYLRQVGATFALDYTVATLAGNPGLARQLFDLFQARLDPDQGADRDLVVKHLVHDFEGGLDDVTSLNEDRVLRALLRIVEATSRTNYFQVGADGAPKPWFAIKLAPTQIPDLPLPRPMFEIFVYSPRVEGVHLRGGPVARGGLRWSDRPEDFRTEVLGLMKAQTVKNAVIVPVGAKGGFVVKNPPADRDALRAEVVACYSAFIRGLLDVTDNLVAGEIVPAPRVVRYDGDDAYLVVAADKGTATFSDIANAISREYGFWLGDAFASGGSSGYDHKAMGITARGAWISVQRHFADLGVDVQHDDVTVVGIGDMSGDVFGNGMLSSRHVRLVAAFDHRHVFLDPDPDPSVAFAERARLFDLPGSTWADYDASLISAGGGVFPRTAKTVLLSPEVRSRLDVAEEVLTPDELIRAVLGAPVDLLWNGGIGTYVKASTETHAEVGDKRNDQVRVDAAGLRCRVVGEGGNLGFTQRGRVEYALGGGRINTDAIDNSAGVDCSDHEVNIKILLDRVVADGDLTGKQRDALLGEMTDEVAELVLRDNLAQTRALYNAHAQARAMLDVHVRFLRSLERSGRLNRALECLPTDDELAERAATGRGLVMPEFAVLLAYSKIWTYDEVLASGLPDDAFLSAALAGYFPTAVRQRFADRLPEHPLRREIVATCVTNAMVNRAGSTFAFRLAEETGLPVPHIARAHIASWEIFGLADLQAEIESLADVSTEVRIRLLLEVRTLAERASRWLLRNRRQPLDIRSTVAHFAPAVPALADEIPRLLAGSEEADEAFGAAVARCTGDAVPEPLARRVATLPALFSALDVIDVAGQTGRGREQVAAVYFALGQDLQLNWLRERILRLPRDDRWQALARAALRDDLYAVRASLTAEVLAVGGALQDSAALVRRWVDHNQPAVDRCLAVLRDIAADDRADLATLSVALREVRGLVSGRAGTADR
ncbi:NAD-glutamate dehydrogenase [Geodermatophilus sp. YIM 151500]|uniref:NAD-glutamate dehydrogenase n=1 Tax=Geodermatophilus sp. YIM 151500 TaxID=2984531 RepID=UPI0021E3E5ED|nr:NAD-glutamate dehydrogenase [Geodermatophilus sp. YIM 151500]MCV2489243.1 NAD-glutamate dehydrogenase [Geodermatophilus sp. YIM 151500]